MTWGLSMSEAVGDEGSTISLTSNMYPMINYVCILWINDLVLFIL